MIRYFFGENNLLIDLGNRIDRRIRFIYWIEFLITTGLATIFLLQSFSLEQSWVHAVASVGVALLYLLASYRFFSRMFYREQIQVSGQHFSIIRKTPFRSTIVHYDWKKMGVLQYKGKDAKTDHPLKGKSFDYFGFDTQERLVQELHHEGNMCFEYNGVLVRFARGLYSWHAEEVVRMIHLQPGVLLRLGEEWERLTEEMDWTRE